jgi:mRNA interferase MazF
VLVLTRDSALQRLDRVNVAAITSTIREVPSQVRLTPDDGMPRDCVVNLYHLHTVPVSEIGPRIATLNPRQMDRVGRALLFALGFDEPVSTGLAEMIESWPAPKRKRTGRSRT